MCLFLLTFNNQIKSEMKPASIILKIAGITGFIFMQDAEEETYPYFHSQQVALL